MNEESKPMEITLTQQKIISNPLRVEIIILLSEKPMTSKQVADRLEKNPGTMFYHIQQLFKHDFLELVREEVSPKGVVEKYYKAKATLFKVKDTEHNQKKDYRVKRSNYLMLSDDELAELSDEISELYYKYTQKSLQEKKNRTAYTISFVAREYVEGELH